MWEETIASIYSYGANAHREEETFRTVEFIDAENLRATDKIVDKMLTYFDEKTEGKRFPKRRDVSPNELKVYLPEICLMEPQYGLDTHVADVKLLLQGTAIANFYGEMTGKMVSSHPNSEVGERIILSCQNCINKRAPLAARAEALSRDKAYHRLTALYVPLSEDNNHIDKLFVHVNVERHKRLQPPLAE